MARVLGGILFFPRGGSAHVAGALARELPRHGWEVTLVSGSRSDLGEAGDARAFYAGVDVRPVDFGPALAAPDPMRAPVPLQPSFEDRPGEPDRVIAALTDEELERQVAAWARALADAGAARADVLHLHHLTPLNQAAARCAPGVPVVGHLHGTELLMLERIAAGAPPSWPHAGRWAERMRAWAGRCARLLVAGPAQRERAVALLGVDRGRVVLVPNGFDADTFFPAEVDRMAHWRGALVAEPHGWRPGGGPGSVRYGESDLAAFAEQGPVLLYVGRFTEVKRVPLLVRAYARARTRFAVRAPLVLLGGYPGEWEGEHPHDVVRTLGVPDVFLAGWHGQAAVPGFLRASDVLVLPSVREQFGQVLVEAMACARPAIAVDRLGPASIVEDGATGWLVPGDDEAALADALVEAVNQPEERARRGARARAVALERFTWAAIAERVAGAFAAAAGL